MSKRVGLLLVSAVLLVNTQAKSQAPAEMTLEKDEIRVGDRWSFRQMDGFTNEVTSEFTRRVVALSDKDITTFQELKDGKGTKTIYYDKEWNLLDNGDVQYTPAMKQIPHPVHIGDTWKTQYKAMSVKSGSSSTCFVNGKFTGVETVTVPAGKFETGRIELHVECRGADANAEVTRFHNLEWFAPGVGRVVKGEYETIMNGRVRSKTALELTGYHRAPQDQPDAQAVSPKPADVQPVAPAADLMRAPPHATQQAQPVQPAGTYADMLPLAEAGQPDAEFRVGQMLEHGIGVEKDISKAADWYHRSAEHGVTSAMLSYGLLLRAGQGAGKDDVAGAAWIMKAAEAGQPTAQAHLGTIYRTGTGLPRNIIKAREWFLRSAQGGSGIGMFNLAMLSFDPNDGAVDEALGREWLQKSAQTGFPPAQGVLAAKLSVGVNGFAKDPAQAFDLAKTAADKGDPLGAATLGDLYSHGDGRPQDSAEAVKWYGVAARRGQAYAQFRLAKAYLSGQGTAHDASQALLWATVAIPRANDAIKKLLPPLQAQAAKELTADQQDAVRRQASDWQPSF